MIYVNRESVPCPAILDGQDSKGARETRKALAHYQARERRSPFRFECYRDREVKKTLELLFHGKCAYCENRYAASQPTDVEHWRPKARYYWLAADWDNLLPSCIDCNRPRTQIVAPDGTERTVGKADRFPLAAGSSPARHPGEEEEEVPLLLHPCHPEDRPEEYLEFRMQDEGVVRARFDESGRPREKGLASIEVYALNRVALVQERRELLQLILRRIYTIGRLLDLLEDRETGRRIQAIAEDLLHYELEGLARLRDAKQLFSQMARQVIDRFIESLID